MTREGEKGDSTPSLCSCFLHALGDAVDYEWKKFRTKAPVTWEGEKGDSTPSHGISACIKILQWKLRDLPQRALGALGLLGMVSGLHWLTGSWVVVGGIFLLIGALIPLGAKSHDRNESKIAMLLNLFEKTKDCGYIDSLLQFFLDIIIFV